MDVFNLHGDEWDRTEDREGWRSKDAWIGRWLGAELPAAASTSSRPATVSFRTTPITRTRSGSSLFAASRPCASPDGEQLLREGDVACSRRGAEGAHQVANRTDSPVRVLMLSTMVMPEIVEYLDSGKVGTRDAHGNRLLLSKARRARGVLGREGLVMLDDRVRRCSPGWRRRTRPRPRPGLP